LKRMRRVFPRGVEGLGERKRRRGKEKGEAPLECHLISLGSIVAKGGGEGKGKGRITFK